MVQHAQTQGTFDGPGSGLYVMTDCKQAPKLVRTMQLKDADGEAAPSTVVSSRGTSAERHPPDLLHKECSDYKEAESVAILRSKNLGLSPDRSCPQ